MLSFQLPVRPDEVHSSGWKLVFNYNQYTVPEITTIPQDSLDCLGRATIFTSLDLQSGYWQVELTEASRPLDSFHCSTIGVLWMCPNAFWYKQCTGHIWMPDGVMLGRNESQMVYHLYRWHHCFLKDTWGTHWKIERCIQKIVSCWIETQAQQMWIFQIKNYLLWTPCFQRWYRDRKEKGNHFSRMADSKNSNWSM